MQVVSSKFAKWIKKQALQLLDCMIMVVQVDVEGF